MLIKCPECHNSTTDQEAIFCSRCGTQYPEEQKLPYVGEDLDKGIYRITFEPVEDEFDHKEEVEDAVRHSSLGEDGEFGNYKIEFIKSTVIKETHPFICGSCKNIVSDITEGRCQECGKQNWIPRD